MILAIETSSELASCALLRGDSVLFRESAGVRTHSQAILPMVQELLAEAGVRLQDCELIAFGAGPGSFTGVRTACGIAQGLAFGAQKPVAPMVTLLAMAEACRTRNGATEVLCVLDARMGEVYWAQYRFLDGVWHTVLAPALAAPEAVAPLAAPSLQACGNGLAAYAQAFEQAPFMAGALHDVMPHAREMASLAVGSPTVSAADAQPIYLRNKIAFTSAERAAINAAKAGA